MKVAIRKKGEMYNIGVGNEKRNMVETISRGE